MNTKAVPILFFIFATALAASITLNLIQYSTAQDPRLKKAQTSLLSGVKDIRRTGTLTENNPTEGWLVITTQTASGESEKLKAWLVQGASIVRSTTETGAGGITSAVEAHRIEQKDLQIGEPMFLLATNAPERKRLEINTVWVGQLLPYSK